MGGVQDTEAAGRALEAALKQLTARDPFAALGLESHASQSELRQRYAELAAQLHPHHYARYGSKALSQLATRAFVQLQKVRNACEELLAGRHGAPDRRRANPTAARSPAARSVSKALSMLELHQYDAAMEIIERSLAVDPDSTQLKAFRYLIEGRRCEAQDDLAGAEHAYRRLLQLDPSDAQARSRLEILASKRERRPAGFLKRLFGAKG